VRGGGGRWACGWERLSWLRSGDLYLGCVLGLGLEAVGVWEGELGLLGWRLPLGVSPIDGWSEGYRRKGVDMSSRYDMVGMSLGWTWRQTDRRERWDKALSPTK